MNNNIQLFALNLTIILLITIRIIGTVQMLYYQLTGKKALREPLHHRSYYPLYSAQETEQS